MSITNNINSKWRTVAPENEIPALELTQDAIVNRIERASSTVVSPKVLRYGKLAVGALNNGGVTNKTLKVMYKNIDNYQKHLGSEKNSVCVKGCAQCCTVPVDVTWLEATYIADSVGLFLTLMIPVRVRGCVLLIKTISAVCMTSGRCHAERFFR